MQNNFCNLKETEVTKENFPQSFLKSLKNQTGLKQQKTSKTKINFVLNLIIYSSRAAPAVKF